MELIEKSYDLDYSDDRLKQIETILKALSNKEPLLNDTPTIESLTDSEIINEFLKTLK